MVLVGSTLIGLGISLFLHANLGLPPYDVLISAIVGLLDVSHGQASWAVSGTLLLVASALGHRPSVYGVLFVVVNGLSIDGWSKLLVDPESLGVKALFVALGVAAVALGIATVAHSSSTGGPFELLTSAAADRGLDQSRTRVALELSVVGLGIVLGGEIGVATVAFAMTIGPAISMAVHALDDRQTGRELRLEMNEHRQDSFS